MINIYEQIISFIFSYLYGIVVYLSYVLVRKYLNVKKIYSLLSNILYFLIITFIYYKILYLLNSGYINIYFLIIMCLSIYVTHIIFTKKMSK